MASKLDVYNLGMVGIDLVNGPIHQADGSLLLCQNALVDTSDAEVALTKRGGMTKVNSTTASGTILSIVNIPLVEP